MKAMEKSMKRNIILIFYIVAISLYYLALCACVGLAIASIIINPSFLNLMIGITFTYSMIKMNKFIAKEIDQAVEKIYFK